MWEEMSSGFSTIWSTPLQFSIFKDFIFFISLPFHSIFYEISSNLSSKLLKKFLLLCFQFPRVLVPQMFLLHGALLLCFRCNNYSSLPEEIKFKNYSASWTLSFLLLVSLCLCHFKVGHQEVEWMLSGTDRIYKEGSLRGDWAGTAFCDFPFVCLVSFVLLYFLRLIHGFEKSDLCAEWLHFLREYSFTSLFMVNLKNGLRWLYGIYPFIHLLDAFQTLHILGNKKAIFYLYILLKIK